MQAAIIIPSWIISKLWRRRQQNSPNISADLESRLIQLREEIDSGKKEELKKAFVKQLSEYQKHYPDAVIAACYQDLLDAYHGNPDQHYRSRVNYPTD